MTSQSNRVSLAQLKDAHTNLGHVVDAFERTIAESHGLLPDLANTESISTLEMAAFMAVVEEGSFTRAAERLGMSQPGLSRQIQRLESAVGHSLLARSSNGASLTPAGIPVHKWCMDTLLGLKDLTAHRIEKLQVAGARG